MGSSFRESLVPRWLAKDTIIHRCRYGNGQVPISVAEYLVLLTDENVEHVPVSLIEELVQSCQAKIDKNSFEISAADMYFYMHHDFTDRETFVKSLKQKSDAVNRASLEDILSTLVTSSWDLERLHQKVVNYVVQKSGLGCPKDPATVQDCAAALSSVWPNGSLEKFVFMTPRQKKAEIEDYLLLSSGVRLFNMVKNRGGTGIINVPQILKEEILSLGQRVTVAMQEAKEDQKLLSGYVAGLLHGDSHDVEGLQTFKEALIFLEVYAGILARLNREIVESSRILEKSHQAFFGHVQELESSCRNERLVAANVVFPMFIAMAQEWSSLQAEQKRCEFLNETVHCIESKLKIWMDLKASRNFAFTLPHSEAAEINKHIALDPTFHSGIRLLQKETTSGFEGINVSLTGKCLTTLVDHNGLLFDGNKHIGLLEYIGETFCFKSADDATKFTRNPARYIDGMVEVFKKIPVLCKILGSSASAGYQSQESLSKAEKHGTKIKVDNSVQTEMHPIPSNLDKSYEWNIWSIRKKAYDVYRITQCCTHSSQTELSAFRNECSAQTIMSPRNRDIQTKVTTATTGVRNLQYLSGLRGGPNAFNRTRFRQLDLTLNKPPVLLHDVDNSPAACEVASMTTQVCEIPESASDSLTDINSSLITIPSSIESTCSE